MKGGEVCRKGVDNPVSSWCGMKAHEKQFSQAHHRPSKNLLPSATRDTIREGDREEAESDKAWHEFSRALI